MIAFDEFKKLDLRVGKIVEATHVEGSDKLIKLRVDLGDNECQLIAGVGNSYGAADLVGRQIVVVANLQSRTIMGLESQGMLLAADGLEGPVLLMPDYEVPPGTKVK